MRRPWERNAEQSSVEARRVPDLNVRPESPDSSPEHIIASQNEIPLLENSVHSTLFLQKTQELLGTGKREELVSLMRRYVTREVSLEDVVRQGRELLGDHKSLLLFFNIFLPVQHRMTLHQLVEFRNKHKDFLQKVHIKNHTDVEMYTQCATILGLTEQDKMSGSEALEQLSCVLQDHDDLKEDLIRLFIKTNPSYDFLPGKAGLAARPPLDASTNASNPETKVLSDVTKIGVFEGSTGRMRNNIEKALFVYEDEQFNERDLLLERIMSTIKSVDGHLTAQLWRNLVSNQHDSANPAPSNEICFSPTELRCINDACNRNPACASVSDGRNLYSTDRLAKIRKELLQELDRFRTGGSLAFANKMEEGGPGQARERVGSSAS